MVEQKLCSESSIATGIFDCTIAAEISGANNDADTSPFLELFFYEILASVPTLVPHAASHFICLPVFSASRLPAVHQRAAWRRSFSRSRVRRIFHFGSSA